MGYQIMDKVKDNSAMFKRLFLLVSLAFLCGSLCAGNIAQAPSGFLRLLCSPEQLTLDAFQVAGVAGAFLNAALVGLISWLVLRSKANTASSTSFMAYFLTVGFAFYGINALNMLPCIFGTWIFALVRREPFGKYANFALFSTALAPYVSELLFRYPGAQARPVTATGVILAIIAGAAAGFIMPAICGHSPNAHKGYSLFSAALCAGLLAFIFTSLLFKTRGIELPSNTNIGDGHNLFVNLFCAALFLLFVVAGFLLGGRSLRPIGAILKSTGHKTDFASAHGFAAALLHTGLYGLFLLAYYNLIGASFTGVTLGAVLCMLSASVSGAHALNVLPLMLGYALASTFSSWTLSTPAIMVGLCFSTGLAPVAGSFGLIPGILAGLLHACVVTQVPLLHGSFCLYNGGFTCGLLAIVLIPLLETFFKPNAQYRLFCSRIGSKKD